MAKAKQISVSPASKKIASKKPEADAPAESKFADRADESAVDDPVRMYLMQICLLYTSPSPRDRTRSRMPSSA